MNGNGIFLKVATGIIGTAIMGLSGFVWTANSDIAVMKREIRYHEIYDAQVREDMKELKQDVKEVRRLLEQRRDR